MALKAERRQITAETLIEAAVASLKEEMAPGLDAGHAYSLAMIVRALEIARREIADDGETPAWSLLDRVYDDGEGSLERLAADIRTGAVDAKTVPDLHARLRELLLAELRIRNPRFLAGREAASDPIKG
jgi:hypothetical protein